MTRRLRAMAEYNEDVIVRGCLARSDQGHHLSSLKSASRLAKGLTAAGIGIASIAIIGLLELARSDFITPAISGPRRSLRQLLGA